MATFVMTDASVTIGGVDLSDHGVDVSVSYEAEAQDDTAFGDSTRQFTGGLKNWTMEFTFKQDFAAAKVDATLFPLVGTSGPVAVKPTSGAVSATNPNYNGTGLFTSYAPFGNGVGDSATASLSVVAAGDLSRSTT